MNKNNLDEFRVVVKLEYNMGLQAESEEQAIEIIKNMFEEKHNIVLENDEIRILGGEDNE
jgi:deoxyhypusine synthase